MNHVDFHKFCFTVKQRLSPKQLTVFTEKYFGYPIDSFTVIYKYRNAYKHHYSLQRMVNIYCDGAGDNSGTTYFEINGLGCNTLNIDFKELIRDCFQHNHKITNIHLYLDDTDNILPMERLFTEFKKDYRNRIISTFKSVPTLIDSSSRTLNFGSRKSKTQVTIYEKGVYEKADFDWNRVEIKLMDHEVIATHLRDYVNGTELGIIAAGLLKRVLDFKVDGKQLKNRRQSEQFWTDFLGDVEKRKFGRRYLPKPVKTNIFNKIRSQLTEVLRGIDSDALLLLVNDINTSIADNYNHPQLRIDTRVSL